MKIKPGTVYIVHHIDTEGPLKEPVPEVFKRIENTFGIKLSIKRTEDNLKKLQRGEWKSNDKNLINEIKKFLSPHLLELKTSWAEIDQMLWEIMSKKFRNSKEDNFGGGWVFNWHVMDHVGFETNERGRDLGYLKVFNHYENLIKKTKSDEDKIHWHFHPISFFREAHISATSYENSYREIHDVICRRLIEKNWFPRVNRAGFHAERPDSNWFLEQWIPFDPSNQALKEKKGQIQKDAINGRYGDWRGAPDDWSLYHPDTYDWRKKGDANRVIGRILNLNARFRNITKSELEKAFLKAQNGESVYVGVANHDWRDMKSEIEEFRKMLLLVSSNFSNVKYKFSESVVAFREVLGYKAKEFKTNAVDFNLDIKNNVLKLKVVKGKLFGPQPYLAIKTKKGEYFHDNFDFGEFKKEYFYTFDRYTVPIEMIDIIAVASNDRYGNTCIGKITIKNNKKNKEKLFVN